MKYLLLDTNIYLHYIDFEQIDWGTIIGDKEYEIVVPYTVIKEIDKYKDKPKSKIKVRAKAVASKFGCYFLNDDYNKQINLVQINDPSDEILIRYHLNRSVCDDLIIGSILEFEHKDDVIVISHDNTLLIKAKNLGLKFLPKMPDKYLISEEKSEEEKEHERCRKELEQLKNRQPKPQILFANCETVLRIKAPSVSNVDRKLEEIMIKIKSKNPKANIHTTIHEDISPSDIFNDMLNSLNRFQYSIYSDDQLRKHNIELDKFYAYCERFYRFKLESELLEGQLKELSFIISNSGSAETGEMNIFLAFPKHIQLYNERSVKYMNGIEPKAPLVGMEFSEYGNGLAFSYIDPRGGLSIPQLKSWDLMKYLSKHSINVDASNLVHNVQRSLRIKNALYVDAMQCGNFTIDWCICAAGCVKSVSGTLSVIVESDGC